MPRLLVAWSPPEDTRNFRLLISGQLLSLLGSNLTLVAVPYQVYRETHSSLWARALFPAMALTIHHGGPRTLGVL